MPKEGRPLWKPGAEDFASAVIEQNPWLSSREVPEEFAPRGERPLARYLWQRIQVREPERYQLVLGPRRVGKTTSMYQVVRRLLAEQVESRRLWWLRLDHPLLLSHSLGDLVRMILGLSPATRESPIYLFLDELVYAKEWDLWLKTFYDERWPVRVMGTSSSTAALRHRKLESGTGRWEEQYLGPCLLTEYMDLTRERLEVPLEPSLHATLERSIREGLMPPNLDRERRTLLIAGGFPELLLAPGTSDDGSRLLRSQRVLREQAVERAVYKDIPQAYGIDRPMLLEKLLYVLASQDTGILSPQKLCQQLDGMSHPTFDSYLSYLERAFLVFTLPNYPGRAGGEKKRGRKIYFVDGAVRNASLQRGLAPLSDPVEMGVLFENLAASHLHVLAQTANVGLFHWREGDREVDLIFDHPENPVAFEIASSVGHKRGGLAHFIKRHGRFRGRCYLVAPGSPHLSATNSSDGIGMLPLDLFLVAVGRQAEHALATNLGAGSHTSSIASP